ncbi:MAG: transcriptional regulator with XRE-family HTH domain [Hyphomicrobiaceae bacterium]|jgi:transcriptional regulator with XRE-family HTH domain
MNTDAEKNVHLNRERLVRLADVEAGSASIAVGGLASDLGMLEPAEGPQLPVFGRLVELLRRKRGWTVEKLSDESDVSLRQLVAIEEDEDYRPEPRTVYKLAEIFDLPVEGLSELSGLADRRGEGLEEAALRFAARSEPTSRLSTEESQALDELVKVLHETVK